MKTQAHYNWSGMIIPRVLVTTKPHRISKYALNPLHMSAVMQGISIVPEVLRITYGPLYRLKVEWKCTFIIFS